MRYIILGANGFIGKNISKFIKKKGLKIIEINKSTEIKSIKLCKFDIIINCLGKEKINNKTIETKKYLNYFLNFGKKFLWIQLSTPLVYEQSSKGSKITEKTTKKPYNQYAIDKLQQDKFIIKKKNKFLNYIIIRPSIVCGQKMRSNLFQKLKIINKFYLLFLLYDKYTVVNYINMQDIVKNIYLLAKNKASWNREYIFSNHINLTEILKAINPSINKNFEFLNKILFFFISLFLIKKSEKVLFLKNRKELYSENLARFIKNKNNKSSNFKLIKFIKT